MLNKESQISIKLALPIGLPPVGSEIQIQEYRGTSFEQIEVIRTQITGMQLTNQNREKDDNSIRCYQNIASFNTAMGLVLTHNLYTKEWWRVAVSI